MIPKVVTFDCAQTLLEVDYSLRRYIADCCAHAGIELPLHGPSVHEQMYNERLREYVQVNMTRDHEACNQWWLTLYRDWLNALDLDPAGAEKILEASREIGFGKESVLFKLYDDVRPTLARMKEMGVRVGVLSNWDYTLHLALQGAGIYDEFELIVASLEYGVEKPDPRLFQVVVDHFGVAPEEVLHVGDLVEDDLEGARGAGMRGVLIDRSRTNSESPWLHDLRHLPEAFAWID